MFHESYCSMQLTKAHREIRPQNTALSAVYTRILGLAWLTSESFCNVSDWGGDYDITVGRRCNTWRRSSIVPRFVLGGQHYESCRRDFFQIVRIRHQNVVRHIWQNMRHTSTLLSMTCFYTTQKASEIWTYSLLNGGVTRFYDHWPQHHQIHL